MPLLKRSLFTLAAMATLVTSQAHALSAGDLAFTSFNADEDGWTIVAFADIAANTTVYFRDDEYNNGFNTGESAFAWNSGDAVLTAGTVVRFSFNQDNVASRSVSAGSFTPVISGNFGLSQDAETLYAYLGSSVNAPTVFLTAVVSEGLGQRLNGTGLQINRNALKLPTGTDYGYYTGPRSGAQSFEAYKAEVFKQDNWGTESSGNHAGAVPDTTRFTVTAVPEPQSQALVLAGLGVLGFMGRRRLGRHSGRR